jgi:hypothetical protein
MGEQSKIVVEHYPVERLPEDLRRGLQVGGQVTVIVVPETVPMPPRRSFTEFFGKSGVAHSDPVADIRKLRDEWDDE